MNKLKSTLVLVIVTMLAFSTANADVINVSGVINNIDGDNDGAVDDLSIAQYTLEVNVAGEVTIDATVEGFNSYMYLFNSEGSVVAENDNESFANLDSYISGYLEAGTYLVALGTYSMEEDDALQGYIQDWLFEFDSYGAASSDGGAWQLTMTTPATEVPLPASLPLLFSALLGLATIARRR